MGVQRHWKRIEFKGSFAGEYIYHLFCRIYYKQSSLWSFLLFLIITYNVLYVFLSEIIEDIELQRIISGKRIYLWSNKGNVKNVTKFLKNQQSSLIWITEENVHEMENVIADIIYLINYSNLSNFVHYSLFIHYSSLDEWIIYWNNFN